MRHIRRELNLAPAYLTDDDTTAAVQALGEFLDSGGVSEKQAYLEVDGAEILRRGADELSRACTTQFHGKCAFTEMVVRAGDASHLHLFRPAAGARDERGEVASDRHYWWLVNDWANLYLARSEIAALKGQVFPVTGDRQAGLGEPLDANLLLDPCRDRPEWYLRFGPDGSVQPAVLLASNDSGAMSAEYQQLGALILRRAEASIRLYGLDAEDVRASRRATWRLLNERVVGRVTPADAIRQVLGELTETSPHYGAIRQILAQQLLELAFRPPGDLISELRSELGALLWTDPVSARTAGSLLGDDFESMISVGGELFPELLGQRPPLDGTETVGSGDADDADRTRLSPSTLAPAITRVSIKDFKAIADVEVIIDGERLSLSEPNRFQRLYEDLKANASAPIENSGTGSLAEYAKPVVQTRVFIGENGSGKSSILQAIALALASDAERAQLGIDPNDDTSEPIDLRDFIRWDITDSGPVANPTREAVIQVEMLSATFTLTIKPDGQVLHEAVTPSGVPIDISGDAPWFLMRAYSATRTLKGRASSREPLSVRNLFDPRVPLVRPETWLLSLDPAQFGTVAATLHQLFNESNADGSSPVAPSRMERVETPKGPKIVVGNVELRHLSDGYRAVITLFCDIMAAAQQLNPTDMRLAEGIVLIDEIGAHLHPRWRTRISSLIRREFAGMQIIVSTHEPLCMRGFLGGEVILVERVEEDGGGVRLTPIERNPTGLRVDQLLTSEFFGLYTTLDPEENDRLNLYYQLRAKKAEVGALADWEEDLLERVQPLETEQVFGFSYREQLTYEAIDTYLTERRARISPEEQRRRRDAAFRDVAEIWRAFEREIGDSGSS